MKNVKAVSAGLIVGLCFSVVSAIDLGGIINSTKNFAENTADIASGKK